jgi:DNA invertase Pin-like site-specific DNA recombinase
MSPLSYQPCTGLRTSTPDPEYDSHSPRRCIRLLSRIDLIEIVGTLRRRGIGFRSLHEALDTTTPGGRLIFHVFAALAEFIRELIVEGTREGLDAARARGVRLGRPAA